MTKFEIYKRCSKCGLEYWEDGRVNGHSCQCREWQPKDDGLNYLREANKPKPKEQPQEPKDMLVELLEKYGLYFNNVISIDGCGGVNVCRDMKPIAKDIWGFFEEEIVINMLDNITEPNKIGYDYAFCQMKERIRKAKGLDK